MMCQCRTCCQSERGSDAASCGSSSSGGGGGGSVIGDTEERRHGVREYEIDEGLDRENGAD
jgi:hypothetical protein